MRDKPRSSFKNYKLISAYIRLDEDKHADEERNRIMTQRIKGFHIFCLVVFSSFLLDGVLPGRIKSTQIEGLNAITTEVKTIQTKNGPKEISLPTLAQVNTTNGNFITADISGLELEKVQANMYKTPIYSVAKYVEIPGKAYTLNRYFNFHGNMVFWPILSLLVSGVGVFYKRHQDSTTLAALSVLNIVPFFIVVYLT